MLKSNNPLSYIESNQKVFVHGGAATPKSLLRLLVAEAPRLTNVELFHLHTMDDAVYARPEYSKNFKVTNLFAGANMRDKLDYDHVDYLPCTLSQISQLFRLGKIPLDVALIHVSPPDIHGYCSLGVSVDIARAAIECAKIVIAQINPQMPRIDGDGIIHISQIHYALDVNEPLPIVAMSEPNSEEKAIGQFVSALVEDGSTLQVGIGRVPDAILASLHHHKNLGVHSEMWSDGILHLIQSGALDNSRKKIYPGKSVSGFVMGSKALYDFVDNNSSVVQFEAQFVNDPYIIVQNPKVVAINSAVEIDLTGQVCADSVGTKIISGAGGQMDFMFGASICPGGKPVVALTSRTKHGKSRLVSELKIGAGVVTPRTHTHFVATEYGVVDLFGKSLHERSKALISIAHPDDRDSLMRSWHDHFRK